MLLRGRNVKKVSFQDLVSGQPCTCRIAGRDIWSARIYVDTETENAYICQDVIEGDSCCEKFGYKYSWSFASEYFGWEDTDFSVSRLVLYPRQFEVIDPFGGIRYVLGISSGASSVLLSEQGSSRVDRWYAMEEVKGWSWPE